VRLVTRDVQDAMVIPEQAIVPEGDEQYVYRVQDGRAVRTRVETGQRRDARVEVVKGLAPEDVVVVAGQIKLRDGVAVTVARATDASPAKPGGDAARAADADAGAGAASAKPGTTRAPRS
jgi:membrane fusion protein (multidrug efflux system)